MQKQKNLFPDMPPNKDKYTKMIGSNLSLVFSRKNKHLVTFKNRDVIIKQVDLSDKPSKKLLIVEAVELGAVKSRLAEALDISRQTIDNYLGSKERFGTEGLLGGYNPNMGKNLAQHRKVTQHKRIQGNKAAILAEERKAKRIENQEKQMVLDFEFGEQTVSRQEQPFNTLHDWKSTRYAGIFPYLIVLICRNQWLKLIMSYFGSAYKIFLVFLLMTARNVKSIEQLKNITQKEAMLILGLNKLPYIKGAWQWFYAACNLRRSALLCKTFFRHQFLKGEVSAWIWFIDGHHLPYTGKQKVHSGYVTQRKMMMPGQTNMVTCDISGRIVDFQIQEGKGDLKTHIVELKEKWDKELTETPIMVFDREGSGAPFFIMLTENKIPFVTWEKHVDSQKLKDLADNCFTESFEMNNKKYRIFEGEKKFTLELKNDETKTITLRKIYLWNQTSNRRTCGLAWDNGRPISTLQCAQSILSRWGASENTFKHIYDRHPFHYHPGFKTVDSENQLIANPAIKSIDKEIKTLRKKLDKKHKKNSKAREALNKDGSIRENSLKVRLEIEISHLEEDYTKLLSEKKQLPEKVDVSKLENYKSFKKIDNEGKNLFDFVTASLWNARKEMTDWLLIHYPNENEYVDLFYAITQCHGWIKSEADRVVVRLEPLQQPSRRKAQEQFCRRLNALNAYLPIGKILQIEVGPSPI
jgi:hypothetical protein